MNKKKRKAKRELTKAYKERMNRQQTHNLLVEVFPIRFFKKESRQWLTIVLKTLENLQKFLKNDVSKRAIKYRVDIINHG